MKNFIILITLTFSLFSCSKNNESYDKNSKGLFVRIAGSLTNTTKNTNKLSTTILNNHSVKDQQVEIQKIDD